MSASSGLVLKIFRVLTRGPAFVCLVCLCLADCLFHVCLRRSDAASRPRILQRWNRRILACLRVEVSVFGSVPAHGLIAANHISYLDIIVFSSVTGCSFVSKSEIASWPFIGCIARLTGTVFVDRSRRSQTHPLQLQMQELLKAGRCLVLFPEGTSSDGRQVLPFRSSLFEAPVAASCPIIAACLSYDLPEGEGDPAQEIGYWGDMTLFPQFIKLLAKTRVNAIIHFSNHPKMFHNRKQAAHEMHQEVAELGTLKSTSQMVLP